MSQQPPLQVTPNPQPVPHLPKAHAVFAGQSPEELHPQVPPLHWLPLAALEQSPPPLQPQPLLTHAAPLALFAQLVHALPEAPHVEALSLPWHCPLLQQ